MTPEIEKFFNVVDNVVALNIAHQLKFEDHKRYMANAHWLEEFCTVDINVGRQSGKSLYINKRATPVDLVVCMNEDYKRGVFKECRNVLTVSEIAADSFNRGVRFSDIKHYNKIYVDEPFAVFSRFKRYDFYYKFAGLANQIIMLGTPVR